MSRVSGSLSYGRSLRRSAPIAAVAAAVFSTALTVLAGTSAGATGSTYVAMGDSYASGPLSLPSQALPGVATVPTTTTRVTSPPPSN